MGPHLESLKKETWSKQIKFSGDHVFVDVFVEKQFEFGEHLGESGVLDANIQEF